MTNAGGYTWPDLTRCGVDQGPGVLGTGTCLTSGCGHRGFIRGDALAVWPARARKIDEKAQRNARRQQPHRVGRILRSAQVLHVSMVRTDWTGSSHPVGRKLLAPVVRLSVHEKGGGPALNSHWTREVTVR